VRHVAQIGAAIGRVFPYTLLRAVSRVPEDELQTVLGQLVASEMVFQRGTPPDAVYSFKHALVQDAAHSSLLRSARRQLHAQIATALETQSPELIDTQPELLAQHYAEAGLVDKSVAFWGRAGRRSAARSAIAEAAAQFQKGLAQLAQLPDNPDAFDKNLNFSAIWARRYGSSKGRRRRKRVMLLPAQWSYGSNWVLLRNFFRFPMGSLDITCTVGNSI
jgi:predicted ATPase